MCCIFMTSIVVVCPETMHVFQTENMNPLPQKRNVYALQNSFNQGEGSHDVFGVTLPSSQGTQFHM